jgi:lysophospholipase L1-like esterase
MMQYLLFIFTCTSAFRAKPKKGGKGKSAIGGKVVTLGDSYSSGCGIFANEGDYAGTPASCLKDADRIAGGQYAAANGMESVNFACAGDLIDSGSAADGPQGIVNQFDQLQAAYPDDAAAGWEGSVISFTIGGNDVLTYDGDSWAGVLGGCILCFGCACHEDPGNQPANLDEIQANATQFYTTLAQSASKASIRVMGYPKLLQESGGRCSVAFLNVAASRWMDEQVELANARLRQSVADVKALYPSVDMEFVSMTGVITRGACASSDKEIGGFSIFGGIGPQTFHPLQAGYDKYAEALSASLGGVVASSSAKVSAHSSGDLLKVGDANADGQLSVDELLGVGVASLNEEQVRMLFTAADANHDGFLSKVELGYLLKFAPRR